MKAKPFVVSFFFLVLALATTGAAEKQKSADVSGYPFWSNEKQDHVPQFVPGLTGVLLLSEDQKLQIAAARDEMMQSQVKPAPGQPKPTGVNKDAQAARERMYEKVDAILTAEQEATIKKVNDAWADASKEAGGAQNKLAIKGDQEALRKLQEERRKIAEALFRQKLDQFLSPAQKEEMARLADLEAKRVSIKK